MIGASDEQWIAALRGAKTVLDGAGIRYWLDFGTLLGAVREGKLIGWDNDIDLAASVEEAPKVLALLPEFGRRGWRVDVTDSAVYFSHRTEDIAIGIGFYRQEGDRRWIIFLKKDPVGNVLLKYLDRIADKAPYRAWQQHLPRLERSVYALIPPCVDRWMRRMFFGACYALGQQEDAMVMPAALTDRLGTITFYGMEFAIPSPAEEYLARIYGDDWRIPNKNWKWEYVKAMDYGFFRSKKRWEYSLLPLR